MLLLLLLFLGEQWVDSLGERRVHRAVQELELWGCDEPVLVAVNVDKAPLGDLLDELRDLLLAVDHLCERLDKSLPRLLQVDLTVLICVVLYKNCFHPYKKSQTLHTFPFSVSFLFFIYLFRFLI